MAWNACIWKAAGAQDNTGLVVTSGAGHARQRTAALGTLHEQSVALFGRNRGRSVACPSCHKGAAQVFVIRDRTLSIAGNPRHLSIPAVKAA